METKKWFHPDLVTKEIERLYEEAVQKAQTADDNTFFVILNGRYMHGKHILPEIHTIQGKDTVERIERRPVMWYREVMAVVQGKQPWKSPFSTAEEELKTLRVLAFKAIKAEEEGRSYHFGDFFKSGQEWGNLARHLEKYCSRDECGRTVYKEEG